MTNQGNPIFDYLKEHQLTDLDEKTFLEKYSAPEKAKEIHDYFSSEKLTDLNFDKFYSAYFKKKDPGTPGTKSGSTGQSPSKKPLSANEIAAVASFAKSLNKPESTEALAHAVKKKVDSGKVIDSGKRPLKDSEIEAEASKRLSDPYNAVLLKGDDPYGNLDKAIDNSKAAIKPSGDVVNDENEKKIHNRMSTILRDNAFSTAKEASDHLYEAIKKTGKDISPTELNVVDLEKMVPDNYTNRLAIDKFSRNRYLKSLLSESKNIDDFIYKYRGISPDDKESVRANTTAQVLSDPDVIEAAKSNPNVWKHFLQEKGNFNNKFPAFVTREVATKIAQKREDLGLNNKIYNSPSKENTAKLVEDMYKDGELDAQQRAFYYDHIAPKLDQDFFQQLMHGQVVPTTGFVESLGGGLETGTRRIGKTIGLENAGLLAPDDENKPTVKPTRNIMGGGGGRFLGEVVPMLLTSEALGSVGFSTSGSNLASGVLQFGGVNAEKAREVFPENDTAQFMYAVLGTGIDAALMELPLGKAQKGFRNIFEKDIKSLAVKLSDEKITEAAKNELKNEFFNKVKGAAMKLGQFGVGVAKHNTTTAGAITGLGILHNALDVVSDKRDIKQQLENVDLLDEYKTNWLNSTFLSTLPAYGEIKNPKLVSSQVKEIAENPSRYLSLTKDVDIKQNIQLASELWGEISKMDKFTTAQKEKLLLSSLSEKVNEKKASETNITGIKKQFEENKKAAVATQQNIASGIDKAPEHESFTSSKPEVVGSHEGIDIHSIKDGQQFHDAIRAAKESRPNDGSQVDALTPEEYNKVVEEGGKLYLSEDGKFGAMVRPDGYMGSLFKHGESTAKGVGKTLQDIRVKDGGKFFDSFATNEGLYIKNGWRPVARMPFNEKFAPEGWEKTDLKSRPDNVFFVHDPKGEYKAGDGVKFGLDDYDKAYNFTIEQTKKNEATDSKGTKVLDAVHDDNQVPGKDGNQGVAGGKGEVVEGDTTGEGTKEAAAKTITSSNLHELDSEIASRTGDQKKVLQDVKTVVPAIGKIAKKATGKDVEVHIHDDQATYEKAVVKAGGSKQEAGTKGFWMAKDGSIHLNMQNVTSGTMLHEGFHPVLDFVEKHAPDVMDSLFIDLQGTETGKQVIDQVRKAYNGSSETTMKKEAITHFIEGVADGTIKIDESKFEKVKNFFKNILNKLGFDFAVDQNEFKTVPQLQEFAKTISAKLKSGKEIKESDVVGDSYVGKPEKLTEQNIEKAGDMEDGSKPLLDEPIEVDPDELNWEVDEEGDATTGQYSKIKKLNLTGSKFSGKEIDAKKLMDDFKKENKRTPKIWVWMADQLKRGKYENPKTGVTHDLEGGVGFAIDPELQKKGIVWASSMPVKTLEARVKNADFIFFMTGSPKSSYFFSKGTTKVLVKEITAGLKRNIGKKVDINGKTTKIKSADFNEFVRIANLFLKDDNAKKWSEFKDAINEHGVDIVDNPKRIAFVNTLLHSGELNPKGTAPVAINHPFQKFVHNMLGLPTHAEFSNLMREDFLISNNFKNGNIGLIVRPDGVIPDAGVHDTYPHAITGETIGVPSLKLHVLDVLPKKATTPISKETGEPLENPAEGARIKTGVGDLGKVYDSAELQFSKAGDNPYLGADGKQSTAAGAEKASDERGEGKEIAGERGANNTGDNGALSNDQGTSGSEVPVATINSNKTQDFFSKTVTGSHQPKKAWSPIMKLSDIPDSVRRTYDKFMGNFDRHISTSIPGFRDVQIKKVNGILKTFQGKEAKMLDIGGSEGGFVKSISELSKGKIETSNLDINPDMIASHNASPIEGSKAVQESFGGDYVDGDVTYKKHTPKDKYDIVHETMTIQFFEDKDRHEYVKEIKDNLLKDGGVVMLEEKVVVDHENWLANEIKKDTEFKSEYYTTDQISQKGEEVLVGMKKGQADESELVTALTDNFDYVYQYWDSGNFKGYIGSNDKTLAGKLLQNIGDTQTKFTTKKELDRFTPDNKPQFSKSIQETGDKIKNVLQTNEAYELLDADKKTGDFWDGGACLPLAKALQKLFGGELKTLVDKSGSAQHILLAVDGVYLDSHGAQSEAKVLNRWKSEAKEPSLVDYKKSHDTELGKGEPGFVDKLHDFIKNEISKPQFSKSISEDLITEAQKELAKKDEKDVVAGLVGKYGVTSEVAKNIVENAKRAKQFRPINPNQETKVPGGDPFNKQQLGDGTSKEVGAYTGGEAPAKDFDKYYKDPIYSKNWLARVKEGMSNFKAKYFSAHRGMPEWFTSLKDKSIGEQKIRMREASQTIDELKATAKKIGFGTKEQWGLFDEVLRDLKQPDGEKFRPLSNDTDVQMFDPYRASEAAPHTIPDNMLPQKYNRSKMDQLPEQLRPLVLEMRAQIDGLSRDLIVNGLVSPEQALTIEANIGEYLHRTYEAFNKKDWAASIDASIKKEAHRFLAEEAYATIKAASEGMTEAEIIAQAGEMASKRLQQIIDGVDDKYSPKKYSVNKGKDLGSLQVREDIPEPIRNLLGEYHDPALNFMITVSKLATLKSQSQMLQRTRDIGMGSIFFEEHDPLRPQEFSVPASAEGSETWSPLNGLMTTPEIKKIIHGQEHERNALTKLWLGTIGVVRWGKTVGSPVTQIRNLLSNTFFAVMNGHYHVTEMGKSGSYAWDSLFKGGKMNDADINEVISENLVGQSVSVGELRNMLEQNDLKSFIADASLAKRSAIEKIGKGITSPFKFLNKTYQVSDEMWKIYGYLNERKELSKALFDNKYENLTPEQQAQIKTEAAERVKNTYPTYSRVWEGLAWVSKNAPIFGNFLAFQAESIRITLNSMKYAVDDMKIPERRALGMKRMAGITTYLAGRSVALKVIASSLGIGMSGVLSVTNNDDEDQKLKDVNRYAASFQRTGDKLIKAKAPGVYDVYDASTLDPYGLWWRSTNAFTSGSEKVDGGGALAVVRTVLDPFLEEEMTFETFMQIQKNEDANGKPIMSVHKPKGDQVMEAIQYAVKKLRPSIIDLEQRIQKNGVESEALSGIGAKPIKMDVNIGFTIKLKKAEEKFNSIYFEYTKKLRDAATEQERKQITEQSNQYSEKVINELHEDYLAALRLGVPKQVLEDALGHKQFYQGYTKDIKAGISTGKLKKEVYNGKVKGKHSSSSGGTVGLPTGM